MTAQAIGSLFVSLGLDSAAFSEGVRRVQGMTGRLATGLEDFGNRASALGKKLSLVTAGFAAVGGAGLALADRTSRLAVDIKRQAAIANTSTDTFQRWAAGAKTAGIEQDKLADILKDVNDKVGDFFETGGGPMADFFENIAPKVGITAEAFRDLSGADALQLYVKSLEDAGLNQQQMTFYMEALASDATGLLPLLASSGKAMREVGDAAAAAGGVMSSEAIAAAEEYQKKMSLLTTSLSAAGQQIGIALLPVMTQLVDAFLQKGVPALQAFVGQIEGAISWFSALPAPIQEAAAIIGTVLGTAGPILLGVGALSKGLGLLVAATGPIGLFIAAATLIYLAWQKWGDDIIAIITPAVEWITAKFTQVKDFLAENWQNILLAITGPIGLIVTAWRTFGDDITIGATRVVDWVKQAFNDLVTYLTNLPARFLEIGGNLIDGLKNGIQSKWDGLKTTVRSAANGVIDAFTEPVEVNSPSRVFHRIGGWLMEGLSLGIGEGAKGVNGAIADVAEGLNGKGESMSSSMENFQQTAQGAFQSVLSGSMKVKDALKQIATQWLSNKASGLFSSGFDGLMGALNIPGFAVGTSNAPGGLARINERGGEIVNLPSGAQVIPHDISSRMADRAAAGASAGGHLSIGFDKSTGSLTATMYDVAGRVIAQERAGIVGQAVQSSARASHQSKSVFGVK